MMKHSKPRWIAALALLPFAAIAHHGWNEYDATRPLKLTGTVTESGWEHPHGFVKLSVPGKTWVVVLAPPSRMENRGMQKGEIGAGATVTVEGYPNRGKPEEMRAERITVAGKTTELR
jgi:Family of unknown function (DUF6152)